MKKILFLVMTSAIAFGAITMKESQIKELGIMTENVRYVKSDSMGPFIGTFDYGDENSYTYTLSSEATVVNAVKKPGDRVKKGEIICRIASAELLSSSYELKNIEQRLALAKEYAKKDKALYQDGVLSLRESQNSSLEVMNLNAKAAEVMSRFDFAGVDRHPSQGMVFAVRAKRSGVISSGAFMGGEKIEPFVPYLKISDAGALNALIMISPKWMSYIQKGAAVSDKNGNVIGSITAVSTSVNRMNNSGSATARITKADLAYRAGTSTEMYIGAATRAEWILLPRTAITKYKNQDICFIKTVQGFEPKKVEIQKYFKNHVAVSSDGFTAKTYVVNGGIITLKGALSGMGFE